MFGDTRSLLTLLLVSGSALASPIRRSPHVVYDTHRVPTKWSKVGTPEPDQVLRMTIGLRQNRFHELERHLWEVSDPDHVRYGQHLSKDEVDELVKPSDEALELVHEWLLDHKVEQWDLTYSPAKDFISLSLPIGEVERMLDTEYSIYEHIDGSRLVRTLEWSLPAHLHDHVTSIQPTNSFLRRDPRSRDVRPIYGGSHDYQYPPLPAEPSTATVDAACNFSLVTPDCLRTIYQTINYTPQAAGKNQMALNDFLGEINLRTDISLFLKQFRPDAAAGAYQFQQVSIAGGTLQQTPFTAAELAAGTGIEGNLDAETMLGIGWPTPLTAFSTGGLDPTFKPDKFTPTNSDEPYLTWVNYALAQKTLPQIISTSYGDDEQTVSYSYAVQVCNQFAQFGARGVSLLYASGDYGVGATGYCTSNDGKNTREFLPGFPNSCPYVTNVGATKGYPEVAAYDPIFQIPFTSGAGFSNYFPQPSYQAKVVDAYIAGLNGEYNGLYNKSGRAYPDISAQGQSFAVVWNGSVIPVDGTSAATPTASAVLALVNDALIAAGRSPLGFLNPWLYQYGYKAFTDVTSGSSAGCDTAGFPAKVGWDAVTGWGTPYFPDILAILGLNGTRW